MLSLLLNTFIMKKLTLLLGLAFISLLSTAQCNGRYQTEIFPSVNVTTVNYSDVYVDLEHEMDIYQPNGDVEINRPLIIYVHGGAFIAGEKESVDCVDFCTEFAKKGYVVATINYRLVSSLDLTNFLLFNENQYEAVLEATMDLKAAVRYFRKDYANGDNYRIDPNTIFVGGYSAGAVAAIHLAYLDSVSQLPTTPDDIQTMANNLGGIEGDAGNLGYSSEVNGIISFAGGINDLSWIDANDEPIVSCQGDADPTVSYNCAPGLGYSTVLTLCGAGEIHPIADSLNLINDVLTFSGVGHDWASYGNANSDFLSALDFTRDFLFPLLPCNVSATSNITSAIDKKLIRITDLLGREANKNTSNILFYIYDDGSVEKRLMITE